MTCRPARETKGDEHDEAGDRRARARIRGNLRRVDVNDDELVKSLADDAVEREAYAWDSI